MTLLFSPLTLRDVTFANRTMLSPMCQYAATGGLANNWHLVHLGAMANGGFGGVMTEAAAVLPEGRITHGDLGIWSEAHKQALQPVIDFIRGTGAKAGIQLAHAGRKASMQRPWFGNGPLGAEDAARGDEPWDIQAPSALPVGEGWLLPQAMTPEDIETVQAAFVAAAKRADAMGCDFVELHCAHGYLLQTFLSPLSNMREDAYGGDLQGRMRMVLETATRVRAVWPESKPLFARISSVDGVEGGWEIEDSVTLARALKAIGVDVIDCSSGGNQGPATAKTGRTPPAGFQLDYAATLRREAGIATQGVGLILDGPQAEAALQEGQVDLVAIGRQALFDPFWPRHQAYAMGQNDYADWPEAYGWWLQRREKAIVAIRGGDF